MRKAVCLLCMTICLLMTATVAMASESRGSVQVDLEAGDLAVTNGAVTLYQVGLKTEHGYTITEGFGGGMVSSEDAVSEKLALWLAESADESGSTMLLDAEGNTVFTDLEAGLYLLVQTERMDGFYPINPILLTMPQDHSWHIKLYREPVPVVTDLPKTGQSPMLYLGILGMILSSAGLLLCAGKEKKP